MRNPSIHITLSQYIELTGSSPEDAESLFRKARNFSLGGRSVLQGNNRKTRKKFEAVQSSSIGDANLLADIIYATRIHLRHTGVTKIKQGDPQWSKLKDLVPRINEFCDKFELTHRKGYISFVEGGFQMLASVKRRVPISPVVYLYNNYDKIINQMNAEYLIKQDASPRETRELYDIYTSHILEMTGIITTYLGNPLEYVCFLYARELADELGINYDTFIQAQFDALAFCNGIPRPEDLYADKARQRLLQYMSKNKLSIQKETPTSSSSVAWDDFKK
jgi:hypothetical protein